MSEFAPCASRRCLASRLGFAYRKAKRSLPVDDPTICELRLVLRMLGERMRPRRKNPLISTACPTRSAMQRTTSMAKPMGACSYLLSRSTSDCSQSDDVFDAGSADSPSSSASSFAHGDIGGMSGLSQQEEHDLDVEPFDRIDAVFTEVDGLCRMFRSWEARHELAGDHDKLSMRTLRELRTFARDLPSREVRRKWPLSQLLAFRDQVTQLNMKCCNEVRSSRPSQSRRACVPSDVSALQRQLQERLKQSMSGRVRSSPVTFEEHRSQMREPQLADAVTMHPGASSSCHIGCDVPVLALPCLHGVATLADDDADLQRPVLRRLRREARRRDHRQHRAKRRRPIPSRFPSEAHRLGHIMHTVLEHMEPSDDDSVMIDTNPSFWIDDRNEDESFRFSD